MKTMFSNLWTTLLGIGGGMFTYFTTSGAKLPTTKQDFWNLLGAAFIAALGIAAKDATTGSKPQ